MNILLNIMTLMTYVLFQGMSD